MESDIRMNTSIGILGMQPCDLRMIARSGQVFSWFEGKSEGHYIVKTRGANARASQGDNCILLDCMDTDADLWRDYFDGGFDYEQAYGEIIEWNPELADIYRFGYGMRILNQNWWEASVEFIISQNNNLPRIERTYKAIMGTERKFPSAVNLAEMLEHDSYGLGYRLPYLVKFAKRVAGGWKPMKVDDPDVDMYEQQRELMVSDGIGPKVASCICLYGLGYKDACPHDVWINRAEDELGIKWHPYFAGLQQQMIFWWMRNRGCGTDESIGAVR